MTNDHEEAITLDVSAVTLNGDLAIPDGAQGLVVFAHGSGSGRHSPRNRLVAEVLQAAGIGTLLFDLLTEEEERRDRETAELRFDVELLGNRLVAVTDWLAQDDRTSSRPIGYFGASTGAAAALIAAAARPQRIQAVVSRGGRPDLAGDDLERVGAPALLIVGSADPEVIELNRSALGRLTPVSQLEEVPGATHLFEEPGALERVANLARDWFTAHLVPVDTGVPR